MPSGKPPFPKVKRAKRQRDSELKANKSKPKRPCIFCSKFRSQLTRHIKSVHKNEPRVVQALRLPKSQQADHFGSMRKEAIHAQNLASIKEGKTTMICERSTAKQDGVRLCTQCKAFIRRRYFYSHSKNCTKRIEHGPISSMPAEYLTQENERSVLFADLLTRFINDEPGRLCKKNLTLRDIGRSQFERHRRRKAKLPEIRKAVMTKMRTLANLYLEFLACAEKTLNVEDMFDRKHFSVLEEAIQNLTSREDGSLKPGLKLTVGNLLKSSAKVLKGTYLINDKDEMAEEIDRFNTVLRLGWTAIFGEAEGALVLNRQSTLRQPHKLPNEEDVKKLRDYTVENLKTLLEDPYSKASVDSFVPIRDLAMSRLTLFNARRGGEPSRLQIQDWIEAKEDKWIDHQRAQNATGIDEILLKTFKVMFQGGKGNKHLVPVLVPQDCIAALDYLQDETNRKDSQIHEGNTFLFPSTKFSLDHASGWHSLSRIAREADVVAAAVTATKMRHRASTLYASLDVPDDQRKAFYSHMGHSADMNKDVYQCPPGIQEVTAVGQYFASIDGMEITNDLGAGQTNRSCAGSASSDIQEQGNRKIDDDTEKNPVACSGRQGEDNLLEEGSQSVARRGNLEVEDVEESQDMEIEESTGRKRCRKYSKWTSRDASVLREYFKDAIENTSQQGNQGGLPGYSEIRRFLKENSVKSAVSDEKEKLRIVHAKLFNERKKFRDRYFKTINSLV